MSETTLSNFINNFIQNERRDRVTLLLNNAKKRSEFIDKLNHQWDTLIDMRRLTRLPKIADDYEFVRKELKLSGKERCIIISNHNEIDGQEKNFKESFASVYGRGFASIVITIEGERMYLETEIVPGMQNRFFGKIS